MKNLDKAMGLVPMERSKAMLGQVGCAMCKCRPCTRYKEAYPDNVCDKCWFNKKYIEKRCEGKHVTYCKEWKGGEK